MVKTHVEALIRRLTFDKNVCGFIEEHISRLLLEIKAGKNKKTKMKKSRRGNRKVMPTSRI